jgi:hypothetical protein
MFNARGPGISTDEPSDTQTAYQHYATAITQVKSAVSSPLSSPSLPLLWAVFLLSLFELMADDTGENWIRHTLLGISQLLEALGPDSIRSGTYRRCFLEIRVFEISRALITTSESILARPEWRTLNYELWTGDRVAEWHPNEMLLDLMIDISHLGWR